MFASIFAMQNQQIIGDYSIECIHEEITTKGLKIRGKPIINDSMIVAY